MNQKSAQTKTFVVLSGKGGTGKTTIASSIAQLTGDSIIIDCDVDAADLFILLKPDINNESFFSGSKKAVIDKIKCTECGLCENLCRFEAIHDYEIDPISCEGCGLCYRACPENAIGFDDATTGKIFDGKIDNDRKFLYASLLPGEGNTGKLVSEIRRISKRYNDIRNRNSILIDGPPGIGCPVNASVTGADLAIIVAEPTKSGFHDLKRLKILLDLFKIQFAMVINKFDLNMAVSREIELFANDNKIPVIGKIHFDTEIIKKIQNRETIIDSGSISDREIKRIWSNLKSLLQIKEERNKMKIAVTSSGGSMDALVSERFGRCPYFIIVDSDTMKFEAISNLGEQMQSGAGPKAAGLIASKNVSVLLTGRVGDKAEDALNRAGIKIMTGFDEKMKVKDAINKYLTELKNS